MKQNDVFYEFYSTQSDYYSVQKKWKFLYSAVQKLNEKRNAEFTFGLNSPSSDSETSGDPAAAEVCEKEITAALHQLEQIEKTKQSLLYPDESGSKNHSFANYSSPQLRRDRKQIRRPKGTQILLMIFIGLFAGLMLILNAIN